MLIVGEIEMRGEGWKYNDMVDKEIEEKVESKR